MRRLGLIAFSAYVATIFVANWLVTNYGLVPVGEHESTTPRMAA